MRKEKKRAVVKVLLLFFLEEEEEEDAQKKEAKRHAFGEESSSLKTFIYVYSLIRAGCEINVSRVCFRPVLLHSLNMKPYIQVF